jgi:hypothetical protein
MSVALCPDLVLGVGCGRDVLRMACAGNVAAGRVVGAGHVPDDLSGGCGGAGW